jgi:hypothetical protein
MGKMLCTLVKTLFQQTVMSRRERYLSFKLDNFRRHSTRTSSCSSTSSSRDGR